jgi:hypothetical protein
MILRQELEEEELRVSQDAAIKELSLLQVRDISVCRTGIMQHCS